MTTILTAQAVHTIDAGTSGDAIAIDDGQILAGWAYEQGAAGFFDPEGPTPDDIVMGTGVAWNQTIVQVASVLVGTTQIAEEFPLVFVRHDGEGDYRAGADNLDAPMDYVGFRAFDLCD